MAYSSVSMEKCEVPLCLIDHDCGATLFYLESRPPSCCSSCGIPLNSSARCPIRLRNPFLDAVQYKVNPLTSLLLQYSTTLCSDTQSAEIPRDHKELHLGLLVDGHVVHFSERGIQWESVDAKVWSKSICISISPFVKPEYLNVSLSQTLSLVDSSEWTPDRYKPTSHDCMTFAHTVFNKMSFEYWTRRTFLDTIIWPSWKRATLYMKALARLQNLSPKS